MPKKLIIGIGGVSRSGKTTLAEQLLKLFPDRTKAVINQDEYIHSAFQMPLIEDQLDWEDPASLDFQQMYYDITWLGENVEVLIVEGLFAFFYPELRERYTKKILVEIDYQTFLKRKQEDTRWGEVPDWYFRHIWNSYHKFGVPEDLSEYHLVDGTLPIDLAATRKYILDNG